MLDPERHIQQAKHNEHLAGFLEGTPYSDWRATSLFYAAVHYLESYLCSSRSKLRSFPTHQSREQAIGQDRHIRSVWGDYRSLKDWSQKARYEGEKPNEIAFKDDILKSLASIKKEIRRYIDFT